jgi:type VI secretion system protein ImpJ
MKSPQRVAWTEGMLMSPHHLQQQDLYHEQLLAERLRALHPHDWGVVTVVLDPRALAAGQLRLQDFAGIMPDGVHLAFDAEDPEAPPARPIESHFGATQPALEVFLGLAREREGAANYSERDGTNRRSRFSVTKRPIWDTTSGANEAPIAFAQRNLHVLFGDEPRDDYESIKVAEVIRDPQGGLVVADAYIPPALRISAAPSLVASLKQLLALSVAKQRTLSEGRRQREGSTIEFTASDVTRYLLLNAINTFIPVLNHVVESPDLPPRGVYLLLAQYAGALTSFATEIDLTALPPFVYTDLRSTFDGLIARITLLLGATVKENYIRVALDAREDGLHFGRLEDDRLLKASQFVLAVKSKLPEAQTAEQLPKLSKIASWNEINTFVHAAAPGVPLVVTHRPPPEIPVHTGLVYFTLRTSDRVWRNVVNERAVAVYLPPPFLPAETRLELLAVPPPVAERR